MTKCVSVLTCCFWVSQYVFACDPTVLYKASVVHLHVADGSKPEDARETGRETTRIKASPEQLSEAPVWDLDNEPPLLPNAAKKVALSALERSGKSGTFEKIFLEQYPCTEDNWFYIVWYFPKTAEDYNPAGHFIGVLLDGTVLLPVIENDI
jgi:hypothetical protein